MSTQNDDTDITTGMARNIAMAITLASEGISSAKLTGDLARVEKELDFWREGLTRLFDGILRDLYVTHEHPSDEANR